MTDTTVPVVGTVPAVVDTYPPGTNYEPQPFHLSGGGWVIVAFLAGCVLTSVRLRWRRASKAWRMKV